MRPWDPRPTFASCSLFYGRLMLMSLGIPICACTATYMDIKGVRDSGTLVVLTDISKKKKKRKGKGFVVLRRPRADIYCHMYIWVVRGNRMDEQGQAIEFLHIECSQFPQMEFLSNAHVPCVFDNSATCSSNTLCSNYYSPLLPNRLYKIKKERKEEKRVGEKLVGWRWYRHGKSLRP